MIVDRHELRKTNTTSTVRNAPSSSAFSTSQTDRVTRSPELRITSTVVMRVRHWLHVLRAGHLMPQVTLLERATSQPVRSALRGLKAFTSVLIVACPCALALAAPFTLGTAQRILSKIGVFLRNALVLERDRLVPCE